MFTPGTATLYGLEDVRGYQAMTFARLVDTFPLWCLPQPVWFNRVDDLSLPFLSLMNVRFGLTPDDAVPPFGWRLRGAFPGYEILENTRALPRAFIPSVVHVGARPDSTLHQMASCSDFGHEAWIETPDAPATLRNGPGRVATIAHGSRLLLRVQMDGDGWIVVSETGWKGWQALRGSERLNIRFADHTFVAFYLSRGQHEVLMVYRPRAFMYGAALSGVSLLLLIAGATARRYVRSRGRHPGELVEPNGIEPSTS
jgi:hypothetical protein